MAMQIGGQEEDDYMMEINTTPLIDVMLVLLIMLIITIPMQIHSTNIEMPAPSTSKEEPPPSVTVYVTEQGAVTWNNELLTDRSKVLQYLQLASAQQPQPEIHVQAHAKASYELVAMVLSNAQRLGLARVGVVGTEQFASPPAVQ